MRIRPFVFALPLLLLGASRLPAQTVTWLGTSGDDYWSDASNWLLGDGPADGVTVNIASVGLDGHSIVDSSYTVNGLNFSLLTGPFTLSGNEGVSLTIASGYEITDSSLSPVTITVPILGSGGLWVDPITGTLTLTAVTAGQNTYSGSTRVYAGGTLTDGAAGSFSPYSTLDIGGAPGGTVQVNFNESIGGLGDVAGGPGTLMIGSSATLTIVGEFSNSYSGAITGSGTLAYASTGPLTLTGTSPFTGTTIISSGTAIDLGGGTATGSLGTSNVIGAGSLVFDHSLPFSFGGTIGATVAVVAQSAGATTLTGTNTYTGTTTINSGASLGAGSTSAFGGATGLSAVTLNGTGQLLLNNYSNTIGSLASTSPTSSVQLGSGTLTLGSPDGDTLFAGAIHGTGGVVADGYIFQVTGTANDYSGGTTINGGTFLADNASGSATGTGPVHISTDGTLQIGSLDALGAISGTAGVYDYGTLTFAQSSGTLAFNNLVVGTGQVLKFGAGTVVFGGGTSYTGTTTIYAGTVTDSANLAFSGASDFYVTSGGTLAANYNEAVGSLQNYLGSGGAVVIGSEATLTSNGNNYTADFLGVISGPGSFQVAGGVQGLAGNNTYTGGTIISGTGELFVGSNNAIGTGPLVFTGSGPEMSPDADVTLANPIVLNAPFDNDDGGTNTLTLTGQISGPSRIEWCTPATLTLTNDANTFSGGVDMRQGNLLLESNNAAGSGTISLNTTASLTVPGGVTIANPISFIGTSATLAGNGTIAAPVVLLNGGGVSASASPGGGPGNLTFSGGLTFATGGFLSLNVYNAAGAAGTGYNLVTASDGLAITATTGSFTINLNSIDGAGNSAAAINFSSSSPYSWMFATSGAPITGFNPTEFALAGTFLNATNGGYFSVTDSGNSLYLNFTPVPEPSTWALLAGGVLVVASLAWRRRPARPGA